MCETQSSVEYISKASERIVRQRLQEFIHETAKIVPKTYSKIESGYEIIFVEVCLSIRIDHLFYFRVNITLPPTWKRVKRFSRGQSYK